MKHLVTDHIGKTNELLSPCVAVFAFRKRNATRRPYFCDAVSEEGCTNFATRYLAPRFVVLSRGPTGLAEARRTRYPEGPTTSAGAKTHNKGRTVTFAQRTHPKPLKVELARLNTHCVWKIHQNRPRKQGSALLPKMKARENNKQARSLNKNGDFAPKLRAVSSKVRKYHGSLALCRTWWFP